MRPMKVRAEHNEPPWWSDSGQTPLGKKEHTYIIVSKLPQTAENLPVSSISLKVLISWQSSFCLEKADENLANDLQRNRHFKEGDAYHSVSFFPFRSGTWLDSGHSTLMPT